MGIKVEDATLLTLFVADDRIVIDEDEKDLSSLIRELNEEYKEAALKGSHVQM